MSTKKKIAGMITLSVIVIVAALLASTAGWAATIVKAQDDTPGQPTGLAATSVAYDAVTIAWDDPADDSITGYKILRRNRDTDAPGVFQSIDDDTGTTDTSYTDTTVEPDTRYVYRVQALNGSSESPTSSYVNVETPWATPERPTDLSATNVSHDAVDLNWDNPNDVSINGYQILRRSRDGDEYGDGQGVPAFVPVTDDTGTAATAYRDTTVEPRTRYVYRVVAINEHGSSPRSTYLNVETEEEPSDNQQQEEQNDPPDDQAPAKPTGLTLSQTTFDSATFSWDNSGDDSITHHKVQRKKSADTTWSTINPNHNGNAYADTNLDSGVTYQYRVIAVNAQGDSDPSDSIDATTLQRPVGSAITLVSILPPTPEPEAVIAMSQVSDPEPPEFDKWYAALTVGSNGDDAGYRNGQYGSLTPNSFELDGQTYNISAIWYSGTGNTRTLTMDVDRRLPNNLVLVVHNRVHPVSGSRWSSGRHRWSNAQPASYRDGWTLETFLTTMFPQSATAQLTVGYAANPSANTEYWGYNASTGNRMGSISPQRLTFNGATQSEIQMLRAVQGPSNTSLELRSAGPIIPIDTPLYVTINGTTFSTADALHGSTHSWRWDNVSNPFPRTDGAATTIRFSVNPPVERTPDPARPQVSVYYQPGDSEILVNWTHPTSPPGDIQNWTVELVDSSSDFAVESTEYLNRNANSLTMPTLTYHGIHRIWVKPRINGNDERYGGFAAVYLNANPVVAQQYLSPPVMRTPQRQSWSRDTTDNICKQSIQVRAHNPDGHHLYIQWQDSDGDVTTHDLGIGTDTTLNMKHGYHYVRAKLVDEDADPDRHSGWGQVKQILIEASPSTSCGSVPSTVTNFEHWEHLKPLRYDAQNNPYREPSDSWTVSWDTPSNHGEHPITHYSIGDTIGNDCSGPRWPHQRMSVHTLEAVTKARADAGIKETSRRYEFVYKNYKTNPNYNPDADDNDEDDDDNEFIDFSLSATNAKGESACTASNER